MDDTVGIDIEGYLDLRYSPRSCGNADKVELTECPVLACKLTLTLKDMDGYCCLTVSRS